MTQTAAATRASSQRLREVESLVRVVSATIVIGAGSGAVIGGLGGRLAMRILFLTSGDGVKGLTSDDGFEIGRFTLGDTAGLVVITALIGIFAALLYLVARPFVASLGIPTVPAMAVFYGVIGGAMLVHTDGIDFRVLKPAVLAVALFVAISAGFGAVVTHLIGRAATAGAWPRTRSWWLLGPPLLLLLFPPFLVVALVGLAVNWVSAAVESDDVRWRVVRIGALAVMSGMFVVGAADLARDIATLT
jgi:hypothetical protein